MCNLPIDITLYFVYNILTRLIYNLSITEKENKVNEQEKEKRQSGHRYQRRTDYRNLKSHQSVNRTD